MNTRGVASRRWRKKVVKVLKVLKILKILTIGALSIFVGRGEV